MVTNVNSTLTTEINLIPVQFWKCWPSIIQLDSILQCDMQLSHSLKGQKNVHWLFCNNLNVFIDTYFINLMHIIYEYAYSLFIPRNYVNVDVFDGFGKESKLKQK